MVNTREQLLDRLNAIGVSLKKSGNALALLGLGSVGLELDRLDQFSDLDFFVIVRLGSKQAFLNNLDWLTSIHPTSYYFQNTADGYKFLFADGVFCEFAVFEPHELAAIPFAPGRIVWKADGFDESILQPHNRESAHTPLLEPQPEWRVGEALTNLYVGLGRYHRSEKLIATRFIQNYAVDQIIQLAPLIEREQPAFKDAFTFERRFEQRFPMIAAHLPKFIQGYDCCVESARAILEFLDQHFEINAGIKAAILDLCVTNSSEVSLD
jgi:lincosamide nucleotidyltransferase B/F